MTGEAAIRDEGATSIGSEVEVLVQLLKFASLINRPMLDGVADRHGLLLNELRVLMCIGGEGAVAGHDISEMMGIPPMNVSRALAVLGRRGWIEQVADPANRRRKPFRLNRAGWDAYRDMTPDIGRVAAFMLDRMSTNERASLARLLGKLIERAEHWTARQPT